MFNSHVHTNFSFDCNASHTDMCNAAIKEGLSGISFTDHCYLDICITNNSYNTAVNSCKESEKFKKIYKDSLKVFSGIEMCGQMRKPDYSERIINSSAPDVVLMSVHSICLKDKPTFFSRMDFSDFTDSDIDDCIKLYFKDMLYSAKNCDFDVCAHLSIPLRYICGVYHKKADIFRYQADIEKLLSIIIDRKKALEVNTSELNRQLYDYMPCKKIIKLYMDMGGELFTIGSDAHVAKNIAVGLKDAKAMLKELGVMNYVYYENRKKINVLI